MKKMIVALAVASLAPLTAVAGNSKGWKAKYWDYAHSVGDSTPMGMQEWGVAKGYLPDTSMKERIVLSKEDQAEITQAATFGDATPPARVAASTIKERIQLTPEDVEYIRFSSSYVDGTPPSFEDWMLMRK